MTYGENKKLFLSLVDEYAPDKVFCTEDEDIKIKCASLYTLPYQELADFRTRKKLKEIDISKPINSKDIGFEKIKLPKAKLIKKIAGMDNNNNRKQLDYYIMGEYIFINNKEDIKVVIEYVPYIMLIDENTEDDYELEIDQDLQVILPYKVASDLFKTWPGEDWTAFEKEYQRRLANINTSTMGINVNITEGEF